LAAFALPAFAQAQDFCASIERTRQAGLHEIDKVFNTRVEPLDFPSIASALGSLKARGAMNEKGMPDFPALPRRSAGAPLAARPFERGEERAARPSLSTSRLEAHCS